MNAKQTKLARGRPATGKTPMRYFRMSDEEWEQVKNAAEAVDKTASDFVREAILKASRSKKTAVK